MTRDTGVPRSNDPPYIQYFSLLSGVYVCLWMSSYLALWLLGGFEPISMDSPSYHLYLYVAFLLLAVWTHLLGPLWVLYDASMLRWTLYDFEKGVLHLLKDVLVSPITVFSSFVQWVSRNPTGAARGSFFAWINSGDESATDVEPMWAILPAYVLVSFGWLFGLLPVLWIRIGRKNAIERYPRGGELARMSVAVARGRALATVFDARVEALIEDGADRVSKATNRYQQQQYDEAVDDWKRAHDAYGGALDCALVLDRENEIRELRARIDRTEVEHERARMRSIAAQADEYVHRGTKLFEAAEYDAASEAFTRARETYSQALTIAERDEFEYEEELRRSIDRVSKRIVECELAEIRRRISAAEASLQEGAYEQARDEFETLLTELSDGVGKGEPTDPHAAAPDRVETLIDRVNERIDDCKLDQREKRIATIEDDLADRNYDEAEERFEAVIAELRSLDVADRERLRSLLERAQRGHLDARIERARTKREQAVRQYRQREYYEAREAFEDVREFIKPVLSLASKYGFPEKKAELLRLDGLCEANADQARQALYDTGGETPALESIDDIHVEDVTPPPGADERGGPRYRTREYEFDHGSFLRREWSDGVGRSIPEHDRLDLLGSGGNADVWRVRLAETGDDAALKIPRWNGTLSKDVVKRFLHEAETWSRIDDHDSVVTVHDWGFAARPWLLMEYMEGGDLRPHVGSMSLDRALDVLVQVADALRHARGIDHLDVKPENVLLDGDGTATLADWGLAKVAFQHEQTNTRMGVSPPYAAPEQIDRTLGDTDHLTDIYQLGVTAYELLTGHVPFDPEAPESLERRILRGQPDAPTTIAPTLPDALDDIVLTAMAANRDERYESVLQFRNSLQELIERVR